MGYISREDATGLCAAFYVNRKDDHEFDAGARYAAKQILSLIKNLPDADVIERNTLQHSQHVESVENALDVPERNVGKWIYPTEDETTISGICSVCGWEAHYYEDDVAGMPYCPKCGAKLEG